MSLSKLTAIDFTSFTKFKLELPFPASEDKISVISSLLLCDLTARSLWFKHRTPKSKGLWREGKDDVIAK